MTNQLKSLELQGYKTFASKTIFEFPRQVTAIVGPNGSGKSNIADAIRWVLGEQAYTLLRGKKTVDMIFSGSEQRPRASMASVSISFDNQTGWLPIDFSEVMITRRAYRSGENEYLLNNQKVRLKEINELLANSGLGERTYTIIGQGLVDSALSLRPEERRRFFEEAAGIGLYRSRREEAVQKLDKTQRNMERVADIMGELTPRLKSLEKSREKAIQYKQIQEDLFMLLRDWYGYYWHEAVDELNKAVDFYKQQKGKFDTKRIEKENIEEELNKTQVNVSNNRNQLADLHQELSKFHQIKEECTRELAVLEEREKTLESRIREAEQSLELLSIEAENDGNTLASLEEENKRLMINFHSAEKKLSAAEKNIHEKNQALNGLNAKISDTRKAIVSCESLILELEAEGRNRQKEIKDRSSDLARSREFIEKNLADRIQTEKTITELEIQIGEKEEIIDQLEKKAGLTIEIIQDLKKRSDQIRNNLQRIDIEKSKFSAELAMILDDEENFSGYSSGSSEIIKAVKESKIKGNYQLVIQNLEIPEKYELCISAALGEILEGVIADIGSDPTDLIEFLNKHNIARTAIVHDNVDKKNIIQENHQHPYLVASDLIPANNLYAEKIRQLLSRTIIVDNYSAAIGMISELEIGWKIATLEGEVIEANGIITAGKPQGLKPVKRKREKENTSNKLSLFEKEQKELINSLELNKHAVEKEDKVLHDQNRKLAEEREQLQQLILDRHKQQIELSQLKKVIEQESVRVEQIEFALNDHEKVVPITIEKIEIQKRLISELELKESETTQAVEQIDIDKDRLEMIELNSRKAVAEELLNQHREKIKNQKEYLLNSEKKINEQKKYHENLQLNLKNTKSIIEELHLKNESVKKSIEELNAKISPLEKIVESVIGKQGDLLDEVDIYRQNFAIAERHSLQAQMKVEKIRDNLGLLRTKIEEDFGMITGDADTGIIASQPLPFDELLTSLPVINELPDEFGDLIKQKKSFLRRIGPINPEAEKEYDEVSERFNFLQDQLQDLERAEKDLRKVVNELDGLMQTEFMQTFQMVDKEFQVIFSQLFNGGTARLFVEDQENVLDSGIEIEATLPGRRKQELALLSGGERSLTAVALIFALLKISPTPFCVLDEVDAMLDESNVVRFGELLRDLSDSTQFIVITHNRNTVQLADILYGVTMGKDSVSQVISLKLDELTEDMVQ